jgi:hypothetical protein
MHWCWLLPLARWDWRATSWIAGQKPGIRVGGHPLTLSNVVIENRNDFCSRDLASAGCRRAKPRRHPKEIALWFLRSSFPRRDDRF